MIIKVYKWQYLAFGIKLLKSLLQITEIILNLNTNALKFIMKYRNWNIQLRQ